MFIFTIFLSYRTFIFFILSLTFSGRAKSCKEIKYVVPSSVSGIYKIEVDGEKFVVRCEMNSTSGGWIVSFVSPYKNSITSIVKVLL